MGQLLDRDESGCEALGDRERLSGVVFPDTCSLTSIYGLGDHYVCRVNRQKLQNLTSKLPNKGSHQLITFTPCIRD